MQVFEVLPVIVTFLLASASESAHPQLPDSCKRQYESRQCFVQCAWRSIGLLNDTWFNETAFTQFFDFSEIPTSEICYNNFPILNGRNCTAVQSLYECIFNNRQSEADDHLFKKFGTSAGLVVLEIGNKSKTAVGSRVIGENGDSSGHRAVMSVLVVVCALILTN